MSILGDKQGKSGYLPLLPGIKHIRFNEEADLGFLHKGVAGVIVEPIQAEAGIIEPVRDFLKQLRIKCDEVGAMLILDEVQTGMGRTGKLMAFEYYDIVPDILCLAKSFGGGMPLGAFIASRELMSKLTFDPPLGHITTFGGHPVSCAAGLAAQKVVEEEGLMAHALKMEQRYRDALKHSMITGIRGRGLFLAVVLDREVQVNRFISRAFENGLIIDQFLFSDNAFRIAPPLIISDQEVDETVQRILATLNGLA
jgi:acetylornithine/succinyldiaminopimelate/putrescine aminotransferase